MSDTALVPLRPNTVRSSGSPVIIPATIASAGEHATRRFLEFFAATIRNRNTREAYYRACCSFFAWLDMNGITELDEIEPIHVAAYIEALQTTNAKPTVKQHLAAVRMLFDYLVVGQILAITPAHAVRGPKHVVKRGKTPVLVADDARTLLNSIPVTRKVKQPDGSEAQVPDLVGLRDRALIAVMTFALARIGAVVGMRVEDYYPVGKRWWVRLHEKGGKRHEMPTHHNLETYLDEYIAAAGIRDEDKGHLFRSRSAEATPSPQARCTASMPTAWFAAGPRMLASSKSLGAMSSARPESRPISRVVDP